jgi:hypothetical protein
MADLTNAVGVNVSLVERLVKKHLGPEFTSHLAWSFTKGRYVPSDFPRRIASPQKILGIRVWWKAVGELSDNIGFRLELWDPAFLRQAQALVEDYNAQAGSARIELYCAFTGSQAGGRAAAAKS